MLSVSSFRGLSCVLHKDLEDDRTFDVFFTASSNRNPRLAKKKWTEMFEVTGNGLVIRNHWANAKLWTNNAFVFDGC